MTITIHAYTNHIPDGKRVGIFRRDTATGDETPMNASISGHSVESHHLWTGVELVFREYEAEPRIKVQLPIATNENGA